MNEEFIDFREYFIAIRRHLRGVFIFTLAVGLLAAWLLQYVPDLYRAKTSIFIESKESNIVSIEGMYQVDMSEQEYFNTQISLIKSRVLAEKVYEALKLGEHSAFREEESVLITFMQNLLALLPASVRQLLPQAEADNVTGKDAHEAIKHKLIKKLMKKIKVSQIEKSKMIEIVFETQVLDLVEKVPNTYAELYIQRGLNVKSRENQQALEQLKKRVVVLREKLKQSEEKLIHYKNNNNLLDINGISTYEVNTLELLSKKLLDTRKEKNEIQIIYQQIKNVEPSIANYETIPWIMEKRSIQEARQAALKAQAKLLELSKKYGIKHPRIISALSQYRKARINYAQLIQGVITGIRNKYQAALLNEQSLEEEISALKQNIKHLNSKKYQLASLEKEVEENRRLYETFSVRLKEANETQNLNTANATIVDYAVTPNKAFFPKRGLMVAIFAILALLLAIIVAIISEATVKTLRFPEDIEKYLKVPFLSILPLLRQAGKNKHKKPFLPYFEDKRSLFAESIRTIRTSILLSLINEKNKIVIITSSLPGEGKTSVSLNLAVALGQTQKILLIDTDLRKSTLGRTCDIDPDLPGLSSILLEDTPVDACIHRFEQWKIDILPAGQVTSHPQELLTSDKFNHLIHQLKQQYDMILIDSAPIAPVADTLLIANHLKNIVFVTCSEVTLRAMAQSSIERLKKIDAHILGVILNKVDVKKAAKFSTNDAYNGYYNDYGYNN